MPKASNTSTKQESDGDKKPSIALSKYDDREYTVSSFCTQMTSSR